MVKHGHVSLCDMGLAKAPHVISIIAGAGLCVFLLLPMAYLHIHLKAIAPWRLFAGYGFPSQQPLRFIVIAYAALSAGILEEIVYRGVIVSQLRKHLKSGAVVVFLSSAVFAGIHWGEGPAKLVETFIWGIILSSWFYRTRTLWSLMTCHSLHGLITFGGLSHSLTYGSLMHLLQ
jgi:membrane protease YdiL (CAAX protease family)